MFFESAINTILRDNKWNDNSQLH